MAFGRYPCHLGFPNIDGLFIKGKELGWGKFGRTYLCTEVATGCKFACKCIPKQDLNTRRDCKKVVREIDIMKLLAVKQHPNLVPIEGAFEDETNVYIVMELCEGGDLFDRFAESESLSERKAAKLIKRIISAIELCHSCSIMHRDLKPDNILFETRDEDSPLKIIDFGLAQFFENGDELTDVVGSPKYIAPEVWEGHHGPKADIWSAGVLLYKLLVGVLPFDAYSIEETYYKIITGKTLCFEQLEPWQSISGCAKDLVSKMLKYNVNERLSAVEVLKHPWILENT